MPGVPAAHALRIAAHGPRGSEPSTMIRTASYRAGDAASPAAAPALASHEPDGNRLARCRAFGVNQGRWRPDPQRRHGGPCRGPVSTASRRFPHQARYALRRRTGHRAQLPAGAELLAPAPRGCSLVRSQQPCPTRDTSPGEDSDRPRAQGRCCLVRVPRRSRRFLSSVGIVLARVASTSASVPLPCAATEPPGPSSG